MVQEQIFERQMKRYRMQLTPSQRRMWHALRGLPRTREDIVCQIEYMFRQGIIDLSDRYDLLHRCDVEPSDSVLWRRIVDAIVHQNRLHRRGRRRRVR